MCWKPTHHVGDLDAGVVDVVLHFDAAAGAAQHAHEGVAEHGVAQVADVRGLVGIDVGVLDDAFRRAGVRHRRPDGGAGDRVGEVGGAVEEEIDVAGAGDFDAGHAGDRGKLGGDFLGDLARRAAQALGELKGDGRRQLAHGDVGRAINGRNNAGDAAPGEEAVPALHGRGLQRCDTRGLIVGKARDYRWRGAGHQVVVRGSRLAETADPSRRPPCGGRVRDDTDSMLAAFALQQVTERGYPTPVFLLRL